MVPPVVRQLRPTSASPRSDKDLGVELLRNRHPVHYARWVLVGIGAAVVGYAVSCLNIVLLSSWAELPFRSDSWALVLSLAALGLWSQGQLRLAGSMTLAAALFDVHSTFLFNGSSGWLATALVLPMINLIAALWMGPRAARTLGFVMMVSVPTAIYISGELGTSAGLLTPGMFIFIVVLVVSLATTNLLTGTFLQALGEVLRRSEAEEQRARELIDGTPDAIMVFDADGRAEDMNAAAERILGLERQAILGRRMEELPVRPAAPEQVMPEPGESAEAIEFSAGSGRIPLEALARPITQPDGSRGTLWVFRDISQRREAQFQAERLQNELQQAQKMQAVGLLAGGIAHDFNNLLTAVGGYGSLLAMSSDPDAREYSTEIRAVQERGAAMVRQLLTMARRDPAEPRAIDLAELLMRVEPLLQRLVGEQVQLRIKTGPNCIIFADPGRVEQALLNLAANGRDAMDGNGSLQLSCQGEAEQVILEVADDGRGMAPEVVARVFEPFFTTKTADKGTGLGLSTVHGIVVAAGGEIAVQSAVGQGTRFRLRFPRTAKPIDLPQRAVAAPRVRFRPGTTVLLAEDNDGVRSYLRRLLEFAGCRVELARSGDEAWSRLQEANEPPDLLLSDVIMPGLSGPELVEQARQRWPKLPFLLMSGYLGQEAERPGLDRVNDLIMKPFTDEALLARMAQRLSEAAAQT